MKKFLMIFGGILIIGAAAIIIVNNYYIDRDINGWKNRAQVSSEPNDMLEWMTRAKEGMEARGMTSGYADIIWLTPDNDMSLIYKTVENHVIQAKVLTEMNRSTPEYQTGLDNLRGSIRELDLHSNAWWGFHQGLVFLFAELVGWVLLCAGAIWWYHCEYNY